MMRILRAAFTVSGAILSLAALPTAQGQVPPDLDKDERLNKRVTIETTAESLGSVAKRIGGDSVSLRVGIHSAELKLQARIIDRPLKVVMRAMADLVPGAWQPLADRAGYELVMSDEAVGRRARWWRIFLQERRKAFAEQSKSILVSLQAGPVRRKPGDPEPVERSDPAAENERNTHHEFFSSLPAALIADIAQNINDAAFYRVGQALFGFRDDEGAICAPMQSLPPGVAARLEARARAIRYKLADSLDFKSSFVLFTNGGFSLQANFFFSDGSTCGTAFSLNVRPVPAMYAALPDHTRLAAEADRLAASAPAAWKELVEYHRSRVWPNDNKTDRKPAISQYSRQAELDWLGRKGGIEFLSDYYSHLESAMLPEEADKPLNDTVEHLLNLQSVQHDQSWKKSDDGIYLIRNNKWYRDDLLEVPESTLRHLLDARSGTDRGQAARGPAQTGDSDPKMRHSKIRAALDWDAEVVRTLTRWQIENGFAFFMPDDNTDSQRKRLAASGHVMTGGAGAGQMAYNGIVLFPFGMDIPRIHSQYRTIGFYAGLSPQDRDELIEGRLPLSKLSVDQQREAAGLTRGNSAIAAASGGEVWLGLAPKSGPGVFAGTYKLAVLEHR